MSRPAPDDDEQLCGTVVAGKYRVERLLGRGGMGAVFEATNTAIGKRVALKFLDRDAARDADAVARFQREAEAASAVESAHIVHIFDSGTAEGRPFLVMELLAGEDLRTRLKREGRLPLADAVHITGQILRALARAHAAGIVHRDLKPDNVFLCRRDDDPLFVKLVDFGISKITRREATADTLTRRGVVLGTAFYMSPEQAQAQRDVDGRSDLFSVGAILFEALAGRPPHTGSVYEAVLIDICTKDAPDVRTLVPDVPEAVARVIARSLRRERAERWQDANEFYDALALAAPDVLRPAGVGGRLASGADAPPGSRPSAPFDGKAITAEGTAVKPSGPFDPRAQARKTLVAVLVSALGAFALTALLMARGRTPPDSPPPGRSAPASAPAAQAPPVPTPSPVPSGSAVPTASARPVPARTARPLARPVPSAPSATPTKSPPPGIATGLTLDTRGP